MGNCLITKLQDEVNNDNLKILGEVRFTVEDVTEGNQSFIKMWGNNGGHVVVEGGTAYAEAARTTSLGSEFDIPSSPLSFWVSNGNSIVSVTSVYGITEIQTGNHVSIDIEDLASAPENVNIGGYGGSDRLGLINGNINAISERENGSIIIKKLASSDVFSLSNASGNVVNLNKFRFDLNNLGGISIQFYRLPDAADTPSDIEGDIAAFANFNNDWKTKLIEIKTQEGNVGKLYGNIEAFKDYINMESFNLNMIEVTGNLSTALGKMINLSLIGLGGHTEAFDLANLFDTLHSNGKTNGSIVCWVGSNKTVNGTPWVNGNTVTFNANGWSVDSLI